LFLLLIHCWFLCLKLNLELKMEIVNYFNEFQTFLLPVLYGCLLVYLFQVS
jgi:hypothetical protein